LKRRRAIWQVSSPGKQALQNLRPRGVDRARRRDADLSHQGCATIAFAPHAPALVIDKRSWDSIELGVGLQREPRPFCRISAARAAGPARVRGFADDHHQSRGSASEGHLFMAAFLAGVFHPAMTRLPCNAIGRTALTACHVQPGLAPSDGHVPCNRLSYQAFGLLAHSFL